MIPVSSLEYWKFYPEKEKEIKLSLFVYGVIVHRKMLQSTNELSQIVRYKINSQKQFYDMNSLQRQFSNPQQLKCRNKFT